MKRITYWYDPFEDEYFWLDKGLDWYLPEGFIFLGEMIYD